MITKVAVKLIALVGDEKITEEKKIITGPNITIITEQLITKIIMMGDMIYQL